MTTTAAPDVFMRSLRDIPGAATGQVLFSSPEEADAARNTLRSNLDLRLRAACLYVPDELPEQRRLELTLHAEADSFPLAFRKPLIDPLFRTRCMLEYLRANEE